MSLFKKAKELRQERAKQVEQAGALLTLADKEERKLSADERTKFENLHNEADDLKTKIDDTERQLATENALENVDPDLENRADKHVELRQATIRNFLCEGRDGMSTDQRAFSKDCGIDLTKNTIRLDQISGRQLPVESFAQRGFSCAPRTMAQIDAWAKRQHELRAQSVGTTTEGGFLVGDDLSMIAALEVSRLAFGGIREVATVFRTMAGGDLPIPTTNDTSNAGAILNENTAASEQDVVFAQLVLQAYKYSSKMVKVSVELLQDGAVNVGALLGQLLGERLARIYNTHQTTGTGSSQPNGLVTAAAAGPTTAAATAITRGEIVDLIHSVDPAYRAGASIMMEDSVQAYIKKLTIGSADARPLWQPGIDVGAPDRLEGYPVVINQDMDAIAATNDTLLFGQMSKYLIRETLGVELLVLRERFADAHQVAFLAFSRMDADLLDAGTEPVKKLVQKA